MLRFFQKKEQPKPVLQVKLFKSAVPDVQLTPEEWTKTISPSTRFNSPPLHGESIEEIQVEIDKELLIRKKKRILELQQEFRQTLS